jgi:hypothetical protein
MKQKLSAAVAVLGPVLALIVLSCVTYQVEATTDLTAAPTPLLLWYSAWGILVGLYLALTVLVLPKHGGSALAPCAIIGVVLAVVLCLVELSVFGTLSDHFFFHVLQPFHVLPFRMESLFILPLTGLLVVGNILCAVRASCGTREVGKRLNH